MQIESIKYYIKSSTILININITFEEKEMKINYEYLS